MKTFLKIANAARAITRTVRTAYKNKHTAPHPYTRDNLSQRNRFDLLSLAQQTPNPRVRVLVFDTFSRLENFNSAIEAAKLISMRDIALRQRLKIVRAMLMSNQGVRSDLLLRAELNANLTTTNSPSDIVALADQVRQSGLSLSEKKDAISRSIHILREKHPQNDEANAKLAWIEYKIRTSSGEAVDPSEYRCQLFSERISPELNVRALDSFFDYGLITEANALLEHLTNLHSLERPSIFRANLHFRPDYLASHYKNFDSIPIETLRDLPSMRLAYRRKDSDAFHKEIFRKSVDIAKHDLLKCDIFRANIILKTLLELDLQNELDSLHSWREFPDTVLPILNIEGFRYFENNDFLSARDAFLAVLTESPGDSMASVGLRFSIPRTGGTFSDEIAIRSQIGCGATGKGRTGISLSSPEAIFGTMLCGKYIEALNHKRKHINLTLIESILGPKFVNYRPLPSDLKNKKLFIIADDGVGDEVRFSQFYRQIAAQCKSLTITCDPRLERIFNRSFPDVRFIPVTRYRNGVREDLSRSEKRAMGLNKKAANMLTQEAWKEAKSSDCVCISQNLLFNKFIGRLHKPAPGAYLAPEHPLEHDHNDNRPLRVGLLWRSHLRGARRKYMYLSIEDFSPLAQLDGIELYSIQHCIDDDERSVCTRMGVNLIEDVDLFNDFDGMAEKLVQMDLLIGISSVPVELGAALGVQVWLLGFSPENYLLRTAGGATEVDQLTHNSTVIAPPWIDFTEPVDVCKQEVMNEVRRRLIDLQSKRKIRLSN